MRAVPRHARTRRGSPPQKVLVMLIALAPAAFAYAQQPGDAGAPLRCANANGAFGVTINSCTYTYQSSTAGISNYYVDVAIDYSGQAAGQAIRFRCDFENNGAKVTQYGTSRSSGTVIRFVSPFVSSKTTALTVTCTVDATSAHPS